MTFHATVRECLLGGFRPCRKCRPLEFGEDPKWLADLLQRIEQSSTERITDADLRGLGVNPHRARRYFSERFGMTFQAFQRSRRMGVALEELRHGRDSLNVGFGAGYDSASGFREAFAKTFGATPGRIIALRCIKATCLESPVGPLVAAAADGGICLLEFADRRPLREHVTALKNRFNVSESLSNQSKAGSPGEWVVVPGKNRHLDQLESELRDYFAGRREQFEVETVTLGTPFQERVWAQLRRIPYGKTCSYEEIGRKIGAPEAARAVGRANGENRVAIVIPCHRVIRSDGTLGGYGGGRWRKQILLDLERGRQALA